MIGLLASYLAFAETLAPLSFWNEELYDSESTYDLDFAVDSIFSVLKIKHPFCIIAATTILYKELQEETERTTHESNQVLHEKMDIKAK